MGAGGESPRPPFGVTTPQEPLKPPQPAATAGRGPLDHDPLRTMILSMTPYRPPFFPEILRLRVLPDVPDDPDAVTARRPKGSRRPHTDAKVAQVRKLIENTTLNYDAIAAKTGVGRASISRWTRDQGWRRPAFAPRATDIVPRWRASQKLKLRLLAERLRALAERYVRELEEAPQIDVDKLMHALQVIKMARFEAMGRRRRRGLYISPPETGAQWHDRDRLLRHALREMRYHGIDPDRAPQDAMDLVSDAYTLPELEHAALRPRRKRRGRRRRGL